MSKYIHKSHNVSVLLYHLVCPIKYRKEIISKNIEEELKKICNEIEARYEIYFLEIGTDNDHVHFLVQTIPMYSPKKVVQTIKSITAREIFIRCPEVKLKLWGGEFWSDGYYINTVSKHGNEEVVKKYVEKQGYKEYKKIFRVKQLYLF